MILTSPNGVGHLILTSPDGRFQCATCGKCKDDHDGYTEGDAR